MTRLTTYLSEKIEAKKKNRPFEPDPMAEEGLEVLKTLIDTELVLLKLKEQNKMLDFDVKAEKRNVEWLKNKQREKLIDALS